MRLSKTLEPTISICANLQVLIKRVKYKYAYSFGNKINKIKEMRQAGLSINEIVDALTIPKTTVCIIFRM